MTDQVDRAPFPPAQEAQTREMIRTDLDLRAGHLPEETRAALAQMGDAVDRAAFTPAQEARIRELIRAELGPPIFVINSTGADPDELGRELADFVRRSGRPTPIGPGFSFDSPEGDYGAE